MQKFRKFIVKKSLLSWIFLGNSEPKVFLLLVAIVTVLIRIEPLEMQKRMVNQAINLKVFDLLLTTYSSTTNTSCSANACWKCIMIWGAFTD